MKEYQDLKKGDERYDGLCACLKDRFPGINPRTRPATAEQAHSWCADIEDQIARMRLLYSGFTNARNICIEFMEDLVGETASSGVASRL